MVSMMLTTENEREQQILSMAFRQRGVEIMLFRPDYKNYIKMLQFLPDILIVEFPKLHTDQSHFVKLLRQHKKTKKVPVIAYGDKADASIRSGIMKRGVSEYLERPLKFSILVNLIESKLRLVNKSLQDTDIQEGNENTMDDTSALRSTETLPTKKIQIMVEHVSGLLAFPFTVAKVLKLADDPKAGAADLGKVINSDPVISANILKVSNSVFFASSNRKISSIKDAIVRIGFRETRRIVMGMAVMDLVGKDNRNYGFDRIDFWYHSLAAAIFAEYFAKRMGGVSTEDAFLAGLLHDLGMLIMDEFFSDIFAEVLEKTAENGGLYITSETAMLGINHNDVVKELFAKWKMPDQITEAIVEQYGFCSFSGKLDTQGKKLAVCVGAGNILAKLIHLGNEADHFIRPIPDWVFKAAKMQTGITDDFLETVYRDIKLFRQFLKLEEREFLRAGEGIEDAEQKTVGIVNAAKSLLIPPKLFLRKEGMNIELIKTPGEANEHDGKLDFILVWANEQTTAEGVDHYTGIIKKGHDGGNSGAKPQFAPVLVCVNSKSSLPKNEAMKDVSFTDRSCDLRHLEQIILEVLMGKTVEFVPYDSEETASVTDEAETGEETGAVESGAQTETS
ncbi:MAG: HDOD domain-containing protein [Chitinivibrionales bacterium]|nr:HDOD domain-containing protein [Chitinivibrionales bacterium]